MLVGFTTGVSGNTDDQYGCTSSNLFHKRQSSGLIHARPDQHMASSSAAVSHPQGARESACMAARTLPVSQWASEQAAQQEACSRTVRAWAVRASAAVACSAPPRWPDAWCCCCSSGGRAASSTALEPLTRPMSEHDVDGELWSLLDLASDEELEDVHNILYGECPTHGLSLWPCQGLHRVQDPSAPHTGQCATDGRMPSSVWHAAQGRAR